MHLNQKFHLTYCTNIHPGQDWNTTLHGLKTYVPGIKAQLSKDQPFGLGLRLSNRASEELGTGQELLEFKKWLDDEGIYVFTMNGFPYGNFHNEVVKEQVHSPDWTTTERLTYTKRLFDQLAVLLPEGINGGISTSPISYKYWYPGEGQKKDAFTKGAKNLVELIINLYKLEQNTGKYMHLDIEPEPDGLLENSDEVVAFFQDYLLPIALEELKGPLGLNEQESREMTLKYINVCYDVCHFSLAYEDAAETFKRFEEEGIKIGKIQVSAALKILFEGFERDAIWESLSQFNEPVYLHQVTEKQPDGVHTYSDLPEVLYSSKAFTELRAHFHVPIFLEKFPPLYSTQDQILDVIAYLSENPVSEHLEVETYTWDVLPAELKKDISTSIVREIHWLKEKL
ncbi:metabolite traffic protein EboE [Poritiphilus flavus]|uniref:Metabolite traffic protein EboE n=1 Tax=Poritiphilus flavus TaxID=2697053 RepID=A0A6L9EBH4_9FLAO|nr:metabolite traffic protein EboE [Poritiphilus flavus]NAS12095.1 metabolite traffic protein EboE [Poritiphilus flavus]